MSLKDSRIGFIGGGAMAEALAGGLVASGVAPANIRVSDIAPERRSHLEAALGVATTPQLNRRILSVGQRKRSCKRQLTICGTCTCMR